MKKITKLANEFCRVLHVWLTPAQMRAVVRKNKTPAYADACATHDYCDANMAMDEAFKRVYGREYIFYDEDKPCTKKQNERDTAILNEAWDIAKANKFVIA